jgi:transformation/transcription domain-associated protein
VFNISFTVSHGLSRFSSLREDIVSYFFEALTLRSDAIVSVAKKVVEEVLTTNTNIPKESLRTHLRPICNNFEIRKLSIPLLEGLERLMFLLRSYFAATLGDRLFDILKNWTDVDKLLAVKVSFAPRILFLLRFYLSVF